MADNKCNGTIGRVLFKAADKLRKNIDAAESKHEYLANNSYDNSNNANLSKFVTFRLTSFITPLPNKKAIAEILSSLDDKIDLHQRQNKTLEEMAETLFRQWFIEEANEGIKYKKTLDLFLTEFSLFNVRLDKPLYDVQAQTRREFLGVFSEVH
jgi:restriction endonuclease S subunit